MKLEIRVAISLLFMLLLLPLFLLAQSHAISVSTVIDKVVEKGGGKQLISSIITEELSLTTVFRNTGGVLSSYQKIKYPNKIYMEEHSTVSYYGVLISDFTSKVWSDGNVEVEEFSYMDELEKIRKERTETLASYRFPQFDQPQQMLRFMHDNAHKFHLANDSTFNGTPCHCVKYCDSNRCFEVYIDKVEWEVRRYVTVSTKLSYDSSRAVYEQLPLPPMSDVEKRQFIKELTKDLEENDRLYAAPNVYILKDYRWVQGMLLPYVIDVESVNAEKIGIPLYTTTILSYEFNKEIPDSVFTLPPAPKK